MKERMFWERSGKEWRKGWVVDSCFKLKEYCGENMTSGAVYFDSDTKRNTAINDACSSAPTDSSW